MSRILLLAALLAVSAACVLAHEPDRVTSLPDYGALLSKNYAGYINQTDGRRAFYWFVESQGTPDTDPLVLWLNGGPGCSSLLGWAEETGPYVMRHGGNFEPNAFAFTTIANVLYLESPMGVGFSVDSTPPIPWNDTITSEYSYQFLRLWFEKFPKFKKNAFFLGGESYAGHYVPQLADRIFEGEDKGLRKRMKGFMVGNPCTGDIGCGNDDPTLHTFLQYQGFRALNASIPEGTANYDPYDLLVPTCQSKGLLERIRFPSPVIDSLRRRMEKEQQQLGAAPFPYGPCADEYVHSWFNRADVKSMIHADPAITWHMCSNALNYSLNLSSVVPIYQKLIKHTDWALLIYSGLSDSVVNMAQTQTIVNGMKLPLKKNEFQSWGVPYVYNSSQTQLGGFYLEFEGLSWAGVRDAGHMVPQFNPPAAHELFRSFLQTGKPGRLHG